MRGGWNAGIITAMPTVTALGNRSYSLVHATTDLTGYLSPGMRLKLTRTVTAPTQCTSLNGTTQYYSKSSPAAMTFTDDFVVSAWVKVSSYQAGTIASRYNGTSGWALYLQANGTLQLIGYNAGAANFSYVASYQSLPLNKWVHVAAQLDMSAFTATTTTSYIMLDGLDVPASVTRGGTNPTALVQAGNLEIGSTNGGTVLFSGKIAQVAIYNAKVTQATILASISQTLSGSETSEISAYSFNNTINDLNANANNLTANGSAVATSLDTPFTQTMTGVTTGTTNYAEVLDISFSTNTTLTVRVPDGDTIPTSGGVSAMSYSTQNYPFGWPGISNILAETILQTGFSTTTVGSDVDVTGLTVSAYIPPVRRIKITFNVGTGFGSSAAAGQNIQIKIKEGSTTLSWLSVNGPGASYSLPGVTDVDTYTSTGSHTYKATILQNAGAGTFGITGAVGGPAYLRVELI